MEDLKSIHLLVEGRVQGVGFRYFVKRLAEQDHITGWVRNRFDDTVEIVAQGEDKDLNTFIAAVRIGSGSALVTNLKIDQAEPHTRFEHFSIAASV